jgi:hypothetical protein
MSGFPVNMIPEWESQHGLCSEGGVVQETCLVLLASTIMKKGSSDGPNSPIDAGKWYRRRHIGPEEHPRPLAASILRPTLLTTSYKEGAVMNATTQDMHYSCWWASR